uniref:G-protein coupled receptors family 2 profile 2 domain-containing protein n=1 Tax=Biomphalaria glabrata TaxID=6526 RepID=A0A2C9M932_BIOGL
MVYQTQPNYANYRQLEWLCKTVLALSKCSQMATFSWMLVEGIYLHNRLVVTVFPSAAPFRIFYFIGWGLPVVFTLIWSTLMYLNDKSRCWDGYTQTNLIFIIFVPIMLALLINSAFLVNIIRVLVTKLRNNNLMESRRIRKAIKATVVLLPLLGTANLVFFSQPRDVTLMTIARVVNSVLPACQGIFVSVLYCFINIEVRNAIKKKWRRCLTNRALNTRTRRQGSRTSSYFLSQSEVPARRTQNLRSTVVRERDYHSMSVLTAVPVLHASSHPFDLKKVSL